MHTHYVPTAKCKGCGAEIRFGSSPLPPQHLHLKKTSFVTVCTNPRCKRLTGADPDEIEWKKVDLDEEAPETLPF